jgi:quinol---cytochrome-c reductase cytochrome c subunit
VTRSVLATSTVVLALAAVAATAHGAASPNALAARGKTLYGQYCISCHGANGRGVLSSAPGRSGAGPLRTQEEQKGLAPPLVGVGALAADFYLRTGYMPLPHVGLQPRRARVVLSNGQIDALVAYVASLAPGPAIPKPHPKRGNLSEGMQLFTDHCAGCHQVVAEGGYVTGAVPPPLEDASSVQIAEAVRIGPYVMPKFTRKAISDSQLDSIVAYVQYAKHPQDSGGWALGHLGPVPEGLVTWFIAAAALLAVCVVIGKRYAADDEADE